MIRILWNAVLFVGAVIFTVLAAVGRIHPSRFEYTVLWCLVAMILFAALLKAIVAKLKEL